MFDRALTGRRSRFDAVQCDLGDVLGVPGVRSHDEVADALSNELDTKIVTVDDGGPGLFVRSVGAGLWSGEVPRRGVGAFGPPHRATERVAEAVEAIALAQSADAKVKLRLESPSGVHELRVQQLDGRRVVGGAYRVHATRDGRVSVTGSPVGDLAARDPGPLPRKRKATVIDAMRSHVRVSDVEFQLETVAFPMAGDAIWAYLGRGVLWAEDELADLRVLVRADDLSLLLSRDAAMSATWGEGRAFTSNPGRAESPTPVRLSDLAPGAEFLQGRIADVRPTKGERLVKADRDWRLEPASDAFDDVSAYYHLTRAAEWFSSVIGDDLFTKPPFPLKVVTRNRAARDWVARFLPSEGKIAFGDGPRTGARCADICVHELTHAIVWAARQIDEIGPIEARGLNEGYADYAQASYLDNPKIGDWVRPDAPRDCSRADLRFPADVANTRDPYAIGAAWAAVLWELRRKVGADIADLVAFDTIFYLEETSTLANARAALLTSDAELFPFGDGTVGRHGEAIANAFDARMP